jgi:hypothetical protein
MAIGDYVGGLKKAVGTFEITIVPLVNQAVHRFSDLAEVFHTSLSDSPAWSMFLIGFNQTNLEVPSV